MTIPSQRGRSAIITGATGGLGYETALALAKVGADVIVAGRDEWKGRAAIEKYVMKHPAPRLALKTLIWRASLQFRVFRSGAPTAVA